MTKTTPCTTKGYRVGDRFKVISPEAVFSVGSIIELYEDDGTNCPEFRLISGTCQYDNCYHNGKKVPGAYECLQYVTKIEEDAVTKSIIAASGADITAGREYPIYTWGSVEYFKDDVGDERLVRVQLRRGARYKDSPTSPGHGRSGFKPGDRVECTKRRAFQGGVERGTRGTVVEPRDPGVNVKWDNGFSIKDGSATISPEYVRKVTDERVAPWADAPEWATHYGIEPTGRHFWFNLPPIRLSSTEFRRGVDNRPGNKNHEIIPRIADYNGTFYVEARPVSTATPEVTPQSEAKYLLRIIKCANPGIEGSFVTEINRNGSVQGKHRTPGGSNDNRAKALRLSYDEVATFLRERAEDLRRTTNAEFEVVLDYIKTGAVVAPPEPKRGNNGWTVGAKRDELLAAAEAQESVLTLEPGTIVKATRRDGTVVDATFTGAKDTERGILVAVQVGEGFEAEVLRLPLSKIELPVADEHPLLGE